MATIPGKREWDNALVARHGPELKEKLERSVVAVCGLGGLGSNIAVALARAGVGRLILIDFDTVDVANLNRQQYKAAQVGRDKAAAMAENLAEIAPYTKIIAHKARLTAENLPHLLAAAEIICEAFDRPEEKAGLVNGVLTVFPEKYLVAASGMAGLWSANLVTTRAVTPHFFLVGDGRSEAADEPELFATRVMLCAAHQAHMVIRLIAGKREA